MAAYYIVGAAFAVWLITGNRHVDWKLPLLVLPTMYLVHVCCAAIAATRSPNPKCLGCENNIGLIRRIGNHRFCCDEHEQMFFAESQALAVARLKCEQIGSPVDPRAEMAFHGNSSVNAASRELVKLPPAALAECPGRVKVMSIQRRLNATADTKVSAAEPEAPTHSDDIRAMVDASDAGLIGARDRALVLLEFTGALRRSDLATMNIEDCAIGQDGLTITLHQMKNDQDGAAREISIPYGSNLETCPVRSLQAWIEQSGLTSGCVFHAMNRHGQIRPGRLSGADIARVIKKLALRARPETANTETSVSIAGAAELAITSQPENRSVQLAC